MIPNVRWGDERSCTAECYGEKAAFLGLPKHSIVSISTYGTFTYTPKTGKISKLKSGGHGQAGLDLLDKQGIKYNIVKTYPNGVRVGNVPRHKVKSKQSGIGQAWFPKSWSEKDIRRAGEHVAGLKSNRRVPSGNTIFGTYKGVRVGVIRTHGRIATVFPDSYQPAKRRKKNA